LVSILRVNINASVSATAALGVCVVYTSHSCSVCAPPPPAAHSGAVAPLFIFNDCPAVPFANLANVVDPVAYNISPAVYDVKFVPPLATANVADKPAANVAFPAVKFCCCT